MNQRYLPEPLVWLLTTAITQKQRFLNGFLLLKMNTKVHRCEKPDTNDVSKLRKQLLTIGRTEFVDKMFSLANKNATKIIYDGYVKLYALEIYEWLNKLVQYFKGNNFIRYTRNSQQLFPMKVTRLKTPPHGKRLLSNHYTAR